MTMIKSVTYYPKSGGAVNEIHPQTRDHRKRLVKEIQRKGGTILPYHNAITITGTNAYTSEQLTVQAIDWDGEWDTWHKDEFARWCEA
jgi:hypothetical protein